MGIISCKKSIEDRLNDGCFCMHMLGSVFDFQGNFSLIPFHSFSHVKFHVLICHTH